MSRRATFGLGALLLALTALLNVYFLLKCGSGLSPIDAFSEADALRSADRYAAVGFRDSFGLPVVSYGSKYPDLGTTGPSGHISGDEVYHGYPPGPNWATGLLVIAFGPERLPAYRLVVVSIGLAAAGIFLHSLMRTLGAARGSFVYATCLAAPMFTNLTHNLHFHSYVLSLLLVQFSLLFGLLSKPGSPGWCSIVLSVLLGFLQGWFTFEYVFVVTFSAVPLALILAGPESRVEWRKAGILVLACGSGFVLAHFLHFSQSVLYFGGLQGALDEYAFRARKTYGAAGRFPIGTPVYRLWLGGLSDYALIYLRWTRLFSPASLALLLAMIGVVLLRRLTLQPRAGRAITLCFSVDPRWLAGVALALLVSLAWLFAKPYHAVNHAVMTARHLFILYLCCTVLVARSTGLTIDDGV